MPTHARCFRRAILTRKVCQTNLVFSVLSDLCMQDYKSLCASITTCSTLADIQTDTAVSTHIEIILKAQSAELDITHHLSHQSIQHLLNHK